MTKGGGVKPQYLRQTIPGPLGPLGRSSDSLEFQSNHFPEGSRNQAQHPKAGNLMFLKAPDLRIYKLSDVSESVPREDSSLRS